MDVNKIFSLVEKTFDFLFSDLKYEIVLSEKIIIKIKNSHPQPFYNPMNFDGNYRMFSKNEKDVLNFSRYDFFYPLYAYLVDYVRIITIELYPYPLSIEPIKLNSPCFIFNLEEDFFMEQRNIITPNPIHNYIY